MGADGSKQNKPSMVQKKTEEEEAKGEITEMYLHEHFLIR